MNASMLQVNLDFKKSFIIQLFYKNLNLTNRAKITQ